MRSLQHVLWRGAMALGLLTLGVGGTAFQQAPMQANLVMPECKGDALARPAPFLGGGFGRRLDHDYVPEAVELSTDGVREGPIPARAEASIEASPGATPMRGAARPGSMPDEIAARFSSSSACETSGWSMNPKLMITR